MQPLIDADVLRYEVGFGAETAAGGEIPPFDYVAEMLDNRIANICALVEATAPPILYLTGKGNFRFDLAKSHPYKARLANKPWHFKNLTAYILGKYDPVVSVGMEADDCMAIEQTKRRMGLANVPPWEDAPIPSIICTRDKDLRAVPGHFYSWELGNQPSFGPIEIEGYGRIELSLKVDCNGKVTKKLGGYGEAFFWAQCLVGDKVDSIPGLGGRCGPVKAYEILKECRDSHEAFQAVRAAYIALWGEDGEERLLEQGRLLHMTRELHPDGRPVLWELPNG